MKKIIYFVLISSSLFIVYKVSSPPIITPEGYFHASKEQRLKIIENLRNNCLSDNPIYLISTYNDIYNDTNASKCWGDYMHKCAERKRKHESLKITINCPIY